MSRLEKVFKLKFGVVSHVTYRHLYFANWLFRILSHHTLQSPRQSTAEQGSSSPFAMRSPEHWKDKSLLKDEPFLSFFEGRSIRREQRGSEPLLRKSLGKQILDSPHCVGLFFYSFVLHKWFTPPLAWSRSNLASTCLFETYREWSRISTFKPEVCRRFRTILLAPVSITTVCHCFSWRRTSKSRIFFLSSAWERIHSNSAWVRQFLASSQFSSLQPSSKPNQRENYPKKFA